MPAPFTEKYTAEQRHALATAYEDRRIHPYRRVIELAAAGELVEGMAPFEVDGGPGYVADLVRKLRRTRAAEHTSELAKRPPRDAVETLRQRIVSVADRMVADLEKTKPGDVDPERVRQAARAIRECAAIPGPTDPAPGKPGHHPGPDGKVTEGATRSGPVGALLGAHRGTGQAGQPINAGDEQAAPERNDTTPTHGNNETTASAPARAEHGNGTEGTHPGEWARAELAGLGEGSSVPSGSVPG